MNLQGSINENQNVLSGLYLKLKKRFTENALVLDLWDSMESDIGQQIRSLKALPPSFWRQLKQAADAPKPSSPGKNDCTTALTTLAAPRGDGLAYDTVSNSD